MLPALALTFYVTKTFYYLQEKSTYSNFIQLNVLKI